MWDKFYRGSMKNVINWLFMLLPVFSPWPGRRGKVCESRGCGGVGRIVGVAMSLFVRIISKHRLFFWLIYFKSPTYFKLMVTLTNFSTALFSVVQTQCMTGRLFDIWPANLALFNSGNTSSLKWGERSTNKGLLKSPISTALGRRRSNKRLIEIWYLSLFFLLSPWTDFTVPLYLCVIMQII